VCTILRGIETLVVAMNSCEVKCEYMTLYGQARRPRRQPRQPTVAARSLNAEMLSRLPHDNVPLQICSQFYC
jgi:hypothetical protein